MAASIDDVSNTISTIEGLITQFDPNIDANALDMYTSALDMYTSSLSTNTQYMDEPSTNTQYMVPPSTNTQYMVPPSTNTQYMVPPSTNTGYRGDPSSLADKLAVSELFKEISYLTLSYQQQQLVEEPYDFSDGLVLLTEEDLDRMTLEELIEYNNKVSTSAGLEISTLKENRLAKNRYDVMIMLSKSTIDGLNAELQVNNAAKNSVKQRRKYLQDKSTIYISSITALELEIYTQQSIIDSSEKSISDMLSESEILNSTIIGETLYSISTGIAYSSLYYKYKGVKDNLEETTKLLTEQAYIVDNNRAALMALQEDNLNRISTGKGKRYNLTELYNRRRELVSILTSQRIAELKINERRDSTLSAINRLSSMFTLTQLKYGYKNSRLRSSELSTIYLQKLSTFRQAESAYSNSDPSNNILLTARSMARFALDAAEQNMLSVEAETQQLLTLANIANTTYYSIMIEELSNTVTNKIKKADTLRKYKESSLGMVAKFSSIYDTSLSDINKYKTMLAKYSSFYESSLRGVSNLRYLNTADMETIRRLEDSIRELNWYITSLERSYQENLSSYNGYIKASSIYTKDAEISLNNMSTLSSLYVSTYIAVNKLKNRKDELSIIIKYSDTLIFEHSSILNSENINVEKYGVEIKNNINTQERAAYEYRETYCRVKRVELQKSYEDQVTAAILDAKNTTERLQAANPTVTITPVSVNLNTVPITRTYESLNTINTFMSYFDKVYNEYDTQHINIGNLSTSIGVKYNSWSTLKVYDSINYYSYQRIPSLQNKVTILNNKFSESKDVVNNQLNIYDSTQQLIKNVKNIFLDKYITIFSPETISSHNSTISSFIIEGYNEAYASLASIL